MNTQTIPSALTSPNPNGLQASIHANPADAGVTTTNVPDTNNSTINEAPATNNALDGHNPHKDARPTIAPPKRVILWDHLWGCGSHPIIAAEDLPHTIPSKTKIRALTVRYKLSKSVNPNNPS
jgi:hypothetical protein